MERHGALTSRWKRIGAWLGAAATVASLIVGIVSLVPILTRNSSGIGTFEGTARVVEGDYYAVSVDAIQDFPIGSQNGCSQEQQIWLEDRGQSVNRTVLIEVRNIAAEGPMLVVSEVRGDGALTESSVASVLIDCTPWDRAGNGKPALLDLSGNSVAIFDNSLSGDRSEGLPDSPVAYNLAPGETAQFALTLFSDRDFDGVLVATIRSGRERVSRPIPIDGIEALQISGTVATGSSLLTVVDGRLSCVSLGLRANKPIFEEATVCAVPGVAPIPG